MYSVVTTVKIQTGKTNDYLQIWTNEIKPRLETFAGYKHAYVLLDKEAEQAISVVLYTEKAVADRALSSGLFGEVSEFLSSCVISESITRNGYEVALDFKNEADGETI